MSEILTNNKYYKDIADTIRQMKGVATTYKPREMASALREMYSTEVEVVPPLAFPSNGNNLLNYRIDGANGGVGDLVTDTSDENYGKYKVPVVISGKNLLQITATSQTISGVTFTINSDKSITCNGTATANAEFRIVRTPDFPDNEDMLLTGCPVGGSSSTYQLQYSNNRDKAFQDMGNGIVIQKMDYNTYPNTYVQIRIVKGYTCNNLTFYPMIRLATIEDDTYEPYIEPTTTNIYLDEPIGANESKSLSDTNVNIPTINGINTLSIDTTIQPSNVYVQAPKTTD